jgi:hypothetical protein
MRQGRKRDLGLMNAHRAQFGQVVFQQFKNLVDAQKLQTTRGEGLRVQAD